MANPEHADDEPGNPPEQPTLCDGDVTLRPWTYDDVEPARLQHDEEMAHWFGFPGVVPPAERQRAAVEQWHADYADNRKVVAFLVQHGDQVAGTVEVRQRGDGVGELSWAVFRDHRGRGVGARAVRLLIDYCFADLGLVRVGASVEVGNTASMRTASRAGLRREGLRRSAETTGDRRPDFVRLARLADDPAPSTREGFIGVLNAGLPTKRVIGQGLLRSTTGKVLLCELTYKREWDLPGGVVDASESPAAAVSREIHEELGIEPEVGDLRVVDWMPPWRGWDDACLFVFDAGVHEESVVEGLVLQPREIVAVHWCTLEEARPHIPEYLEVLLTRLLEPATGPVYLENGREPTDLSELT